MLPFGLNLSPYVFTRLTNLVAVYVDDFILGAETKGVLVAGAMVTDASKCPRTNYVRRPTKFVSRVKTYGLMFRPNGRTVATTTLPFGLNLSPYVFTRLTKIFLH